MLATVFALGLSACGGDDENDGGNTGYGSGTKTEQTDTAATETTPVETTGTETSGGEAEGGGAKQPSTSPEEQEGGAGDADGVEYELSGGGKTVKAGGEIETAGTTFDGLRTGEKLVLSGPQGKVTVIANAEPGP